MFVHAHTFEGSVKIVLMLGEGLVSDIGIYPSQDDGWEKATALYCLTGDRYQVRTLADDILHDTSVYFREEPCDEEYVVDEADEDEEDDEAAFWDAAAE